MIRMDLDVRNSTTDPARTDLAPLQVVEEGCLQHTLRAKGGPGRDDESAHENVRGREPGTTHEIHRVGGSENASV